MTCAPSDRESDVTAAAHTRAPQRARHGLLTPLDSASRPSPPLEVPGRIEKEEGGPECTGAVNSESLLALL